MSNAAVGQQSAEVRSDIAKALWALALSIVLALGMQGLEYAGVFANAEGIVANWYLADRTTQYSTSRIVTVAIDDLDFKNWFNGKSPLDEETFFRLLEVFPSTQASVIGVDILTDSERYRTVADGKRLSSLMNGPIPLVLAAEAVAPQEEKTNFALWLLGHHDELVTRPGNVLGRSVTELQREAEKAKWGIPLFPADLDRTVRRLPRTLLDERNPKPRRPTIRTFAAAVRAAFCDTSKACDNKKFKNEEQKNSEFYISYGQNVSLSADYAVRELFDCMTLGVKNSPQENLCQEWKWDPTDGARLDDAIVLLGGTYGTSRDFFLTPAGQRISGLIMNAHAVHGEIHGPVVKEHERFQIFLLDVWFGLLIAFCFTLTSWLQPERAWLGAVLSISLAIVAIAFFFVPRLLDSGILWLSWTGILLMGVSWHIVTETRNMRMKQH
jgi:CHASE2 domain-containing sensor protein